MQPQLGLIVQGTDRHYPLGPGGSATVGRTIESEIHIVDQAVSGPTGPRSRRRTPSP